MPANIDGTFDSSRLLAYRLYVLKYMELLDTMGGVPSLEALEKFMRVIESDFPNDKVHPGDVIIALASLAWSMARTSKRSAKEEVRKIVDHWKGTGNRSALRSDRPGDSLRRKGIVLPSRVGRPN